MLLKLLRVNPETVNIAFAMVFICAVLASILSCASFVLFFLLPYLINHLSINWH